MRNNFEKFVNESVPGRVWHEMYKHSERSCLDSFSFLMKENPLGLTNGLQPYPDSNRENRTSQNILFRQECWSFLHIMFVTNYSAK